jgi:type III secretion protein Q
VTGLPLELPKLSRGFAALTADARDAGDAAAAAAAAGIGGVLSCPVAIRGRALPAAAAPSVGAAHVFIALEAIAAHALLEVEASLVAAALADAARGAPPPAALRATAVERSFFELLALSAVDACRTTAVDALAPRLAAEASAPAGALAIALDIALGERRGSGRLFVPPAALRTLAGTPLLSNAAAAVAVDASYRDGAAVLSRDEIGALEPGDAVLVTPALPSIVFPGGLAARGDLGDGHLHVQEIRMTDAQAAFPLTVAVEVARVSITLGELARLEPGAALPLDVRRDGRAILRAGERALAYGHLVDIDGALAVLVDGIGERP